MRPIVHRIVEGGVVDFFQTRVARPIAVVTAITAFVGGTSVGVGSQSGARFNWASHNLDTRNSRYAPLDEVNTSNVASLTVKWIFTAPAADNIGRGTPLAVDGVLYFNSGSKLFAVDGATGTPVWTTEIEPPFPANGRGPIYADGRIYAYGQAVIYAVDAKTGKVIESFGNKGRLLVADAALNAKYRDKDARGYSIAAPPAYHDGTLFIGLAVSEAHIPGGLIVAVDSRTGAVRWVFNTVPQGPADEGWEIAKDTWRGGQRVGGGMWTQPAIDPELGLVYVNAGNPSPDYDGSARKGQNLFTNSIIALHLQTGKIAWYFQTLHHEVWDFDLVSGPILFDVTVGDRTIKGVASAGKNCYLYGWHRDTGRPINPMVEMAVPTQSDVPGEEIWPTQPFPYTAKGVPMQPFCQTFPTIADPELAKRARQIYQPYSITQKYIVSHGGSSFGSPSFSPSTNLLYITGKNAAVSFTVRPVGDSLRQGQGANIGHDGVIAEGPFRAAAVGVPNTETVTAYHPGTGELVWQAEFPTTSSIGSAGNFVTAGNLVFQGSESGSFYAFDARTGRQLFTYQAPRSIRTSPLTFTSNGKQYVTVVATNAVVTFGLP
jgi:quinohemoprotein ethanol dehydrogenase